MQKPRAKIEIGIHWLLFLLSIASGCLQKRDETFAQLDAAKIYYQIGKFDSCITLLNKLIKSDSSIGAAYYFLAKANYEINNYEDGLRYLDQAENKMFNADSVHSFRLDVLFAKQDYLECINACDAIISRNTSNSRIYFRKAAALYNLGVKAEGNMVENKLAEALATINIAINLKSTDNEFYVLRGAVRYALFDKKGALSDIDRAISNSPDDYTILFRAYLFKSTIYEDIGDIIYSEALLDSAITFNPNHSESYLARGDLRTRIRKFTLACDDFRKALELGDRAAIKRIRNYCENN